MQSIYLTIVLAPLVAAIVAGLFGTHHRRAGAHSITICGRGALLRAVAAMCCTNSSCEGMAPFNGTVYTWLLSDGLHMEVGFLIDHLSAMMMVVVTFVSLMVHMYTIGYMHDDRRLSALLQLHLAVHLLHADAGDVEQLHAAVLRLGRRWAWCPIC